jgi:hypothetical protein
LSTDVIHITIEFIEYQSPCEISEIFRESKTLYCHENTALATEAVLCGCPAIFMTNAYLERPIAVDAGAERDRVAQMSTQISFCYINMSLREAIY